MICPNMASLLVPLGEGLAELNGLYIHRMCLTLSFAEVICSGRLRASL